MTAIRGSAGFVGQLVLAAAMGSLATPVAALAQAPGAGKAVPPAVEIAGSQLHKLHSAVTGQDYVLQVLLPRGYEGGTATYPVIYAVDGQWDFALIQAIYGQLYYDGFLPAAIVVGITWGGEKPDYDARRAFDLTPGAAGQPARYGNAEKFLAFIEKEAIPYVESNFRARKDDRTLTGSSFGGLFTLYALFHQPGIFNRYALTSPAWGWDNGSLYTHAEKFSKTKLSRPAKVYMAVGEHEDVAGFQKLASTITGYGIAGLDLEAKVVSGAGHSGAKAEGYTRGLQYVFARPCVTVDPKVLERYAGEYQVGMQAARVAVEDGALVAYAPGGGQKIRLCAQSDHDFHIVGQFTTFHIVEDKDGKVTAIQVEQFSGSSTAVKK